MPRLRRGALAALVGSALIGQDEPERRPPWPLDLAVAERPLPPFAEAGVEAAHLDVMGIDGSVLYLTCAGEVTAVLDVAVARLVAMPRSAVVLRFIGFGDRDRVEGLSATVAGSFARSGWRVARRLVFDGASWRELA